MSIRIFIALLHAFPEKTGSLSHINTDSEGRKYA
jgi:hypothetical protein